MNNAPKVGFVGLGEVGSIFSRAVEENGAQVLIYDQLLETPEGFETMQKRLQGSGINTASLEEVIQNSKYILSTVTTQTAKGAAEACSPLLQPGQMYIDLNSTSPLAKAALGDIIRKSGADFVEGAILGAVGATGVKTRILTAGEKGQEAAQLLTALGLNSSFYSPEVGKAATFKMLRGIFSKGLEALLIEVLVAGKRAAIAQDLWSDIVDFMNETPFDRIAANWVQSHAVAYERRYWEVTQIKETMEEIGIEPVMTTATEALFHRSRSLGLTEAFPTKPASFEEVIGYLNQQLNNKEN